MSGRYMHKREGEWCNWSKAQGLSLKHSVQAFGIPNRPGILGSGEWYRGIS